MLIRKGRPYQAQILLNPLNKESATGSLVGCVPQVEIEAPNEGEFKPTEKLIKQAALTEAKWV